MERTLRCTFISCAALLAVAVTLSTSVVARALTDCSHDADCPEGYACEHQEDDGALPDCRDGDSDCICTNKDCSSDSDCPAWASCKQYTFSVCTTNTASSCGPKMTQTFCVPHAQLPCEHDSDCGDGYTCSLETSGSVCHMYSDLGESTDDAGVPASDDECKACELKDIACEHDAQCPPSLKCVDPYSHDEWEENGASPHTVCYPFPYHTNTVFASGQGNTDAGTSTTANDTKAEKDSGCSVAAQGSDDDAPLGALSLLLLFAAALRRRTATR